MKPVFYRGVLLLKLSHLPSGLRWEEPEGSPNLIPTPIELALELDGAKTAVGKILVHGALQGVGVAVL